MSYLRGPLTKDQIEELMRGAPRAAAEPAQVAPAAAAATAPGVADDATPVAPSVAPGVTVAYLDPSAAWATQVGAVAGATRLQAFLAARVNVRFDDSSAGVDESEEFEALYGPLDGGLDLDSETIVDFDDRDFAGSAPDGASYVVTEAPLDKATFFSAAQRDIERRLVATRSLELYRNRQLKLTSRPGESQDQFAARCDQAAQAEADRDAAKLKDRLEAKRDRLESALELAKRRVEELEQGQRSYQANELIAGAGAVLGALLGGRRSVRSIAGSAGSLSTRHGMATRARERKETAEHRAQQAVDDLEQLEQEILDEVAEIDEEWRAKAAEIETVSIRLEATDVDVMETRLVWIPTR
jgi:hypothetical protein